MNESRDFGFFWLIFFTDCNFKLFFDCFDGVKSLIAGVGLLKVICFYHNNLGLVNYHRHHQYCFRSTKVKGQIFHQYQEHGHNNKIWNKLRQNNLKANCTSLPQCHIVLMLCFSTQSNVGCLLSIVYLNEFVSNNVWMNLF